MATAPIAPNVHVSNHPCVRAKLSQLRSASTPARETKQLVHDIATLVACEALAHGLEVVQTGTDVSPLGYPYPIETLSPDSLTLVPILRSGLSMVDAVSALLPEPTSIHHLGMYREKSTLQPVEYYNNLPYHNTTSTSLNPKAGGQGNGIPDVAIILDPIVATGCTMSAAIETLRDWGVQRILSISILGSESGLKRASETWEEGVEMWVGGCDAEIDGRGMIKPGLGDIGDRLYLTVGK